MSEKEADRVPKFLPNEVKKDPPPLGEIYDNVSCTCGKLCKREPQSFSHCGSFDHHCEQRLQIFLFSFCA